MISVPNVMIILKQLLLSTLIYRAMKICSNILAHMIDKVEASIVVLPADSNLVNALQNYNFFIA